MVGRDLHMIRDVLRKSIDLVPIPVIESWYGKVLDQFLNDYILCLHSLCQETCPIHTARTQCSRMLLHVTGHYITLS